MANTYATTYSQDDIAALEEEQKTKVAETENFYDTAIEDAKKLYSKQEQAVKDWGKEQERIQQEQSDLAIEGIKKAQKEAEEDYQKEQSAAYTDFKKSTAKHGADAERLASAGLIGSGYAESSETRKYNAYQNRLATAWAALEQIDADFELAIKDAQLKNSAALAEIAYKTWSEGLYIAMQGFEAENRLLLEKADSIDAVNADYDSRIQYILEKIAEEKAAAEEAAALTNEETFIEDAGTEVVDDSTDSGGNSYFSELLAEGIKGGQNGAGAAFVDTPTQLGSVSASTGTRDTIPISEHMRQKDASVGGSYTGYSNPILNQGSPGAVVSNAAKNVKQISTDYYKGAINADARKYGTFSNGYQPKGISGHGKLTKSGQTYTFNTKTLSGEYKYVTQNVWKAEDGTLWYWEGRQNKYLPYHSGYRRST